MHIEKKKKKSIALSSGHQRQRYFKRAAGDLNLLLNQTPLSWTNPQKNRGKEKKLTDPALIYTDTVKASVFDKLQVNKDRQKGDKYIKQDSSEVYSCAEITRRSPPAWLWWCHHGLLTVSPRSVLMFKNVSFLH